MSTIFQEELDALIYAHERFAKGQANGRRLDLGMQTAQDLDFRGHLLTEADLVGAELQGSNFQGVQMERANMFGAILSRCNFQDANLTNCDFRGAHMRGTDFSNAVLTDANFGEGSLLQRDTRGNLEPVHDRIPNEERLMEAIFRNVSAEGARITSSLAFASDLSFANFRYAKLNGVNFTGGNLRGASFYQADLTNCNFKDTNMSSAVLSGAILDNTNFEGANLTASIIDRQEYSNRAFNKAVLPKTLDQLDKGLQAILIAHNLWVESLGRKGHQADLAEHDLSNVVLNFAQLQAANLRLALMQGGAFNNATFSMADLSECNAQNALMIKTDCRGTNFQQANLEGVDLTESLCSPMTILTGLTSAHPISWPTNFSYSCLRGAKLSKCNLKGANFENAILAGVDFRGADLRKASLLDADLTGADIRDAILDGADLRGAIGIKL